MNDIRFETTSYSCKYDPGEGKAEYHVDVEILGNKKLVRISCVGADGLTTLHNETHGRYESAHDLARNIIRAHMES